MGGPGAGLRLGRLPRVWLRRHGNGYFGRVHRDGLASVIVGPAVIAQNSLRTVAAVAAGKAAGAASRLLGRGGGTTIPGDVARAIDPGINRAISGGLRRGCVVVTGTNGKTTTAGLITAICRQAGISVVSNSSGANLAFGVTAALLADCTLSGVPVSEMGVFEVDELAFPGVVAELEPSCAVVLNFLRDQLDRSGELNSTAAAVGRGISRLGKQTRLVVNCDDPSVVALVPEGVAAVTFGVDARSVMSASLPRVADARFCPRCQRRMEFSGVVLAHCGDYHCPGCGFVRPQAQVSAALVDADVDQMDVTLGDGLHLQCQIGGVYNVYNVLAAVAACRQLGVPDDVIATALHDFVPVFGRQEQFLLDGKQFRFFLAKNPTGMDEVFRTTIESGIYHNYLLALNDGIADGRDVSWIWDVDFERLASSAPDLVVVSGSRAMDLALRLKYAGIRSGTVLVEPDPEKAMAVSCQRAQDDRIAVIPTYTAMLSLRQVVERRGAVGRYWAAPAAKGVPLPGNTPDAAVTAAPGEQPIPGGKVHG